MPTLFLFIETEYFEIHRTAVVVTSSRNDGQHTTVLQRG